MKLTRIPEKQAAKAALVPQSSPETILPYKERPAANRHSASNRSEMTAENLFSLFTAEVIEKDTKFVR